MTKMQKVEKFSGRKLKVMLDRELKGRMTGKADFKQKILQIIVKMV